MTTGATQQLGLALPVQGELPGTWGDTVNNGITQYTNIAIAATLTLTGDGAVTLANTTGDASASNIVSSLSGAGTVTAQFAIVRITGTLTTTKIVTGPSYSKTYVVVNAATGGTVTFKAAGQTGVSVIVGESALVYYNGTDYVKVASSTIAGDVVASANNAFTGANTFYNSTGQTFGTGTAAEDGIIVKGRAGGTSSYRISFVPTTLTANRTTTFPDADTTIPVATQTLTFSGPTAARTITLPDENFAAGYRNIPAGADKTGSYSLAVTDVGKVISIGTGGAITVPDATFSAGDAVLLFNNTSATVTITMSITTAYIAGVDLDKGVISLATRGIANILFVSGTICTVTGNVS